MSYVPAALRRLVAERAGGLCEYCLIHESDTFFGCQLDHIVPEKHGGPTVAENLALSCIFCNRNKGSDIAAFSPRTGVVTRLYHPRTDRWSEHFKLSADELMIQEVIDIGAATIQLLQLNHPDRILERQTLKEVGRYPIPIAKAWIKC